ncbi:MAG: hypothetical protein ACFFAO_19565 [Candidatus Hermodarchaeota archaeon]
MVEWVDGFFRPLAEFAAFFILLLGVMWLIFSSYEANRRESWRKLTGIDDWDFDITPFLKGLTYLGFVLGILCILAGVSGLILDAPPSLAYATATENSVNYFTSILLIILGIFTFMKPLNDLPIASIIGLAAASLVSAAIVGVIMYFDVSITVYIAVALIVIFIIIFGIVAVVAWIYTAGLMLVSKIISWPIFAFAIAILCFIQGFMLAFLGTSIV